MSISRLSVRDAMITIAAATVMTYFGVYFLLVAPRRANFLESARRLNAAARNEELEAERALATIEKRRRLIADLTGRSASPPDQREGAEWLVVEAEKECKLAAAEAAESTRRSVVHRKAATIYEQAAKRPWTTILGRADLPVD